ncbi:MAG TPA: ABC transporter substrate-binding protein, partial [Acidimicrobiales bacterium]|nr:ABC transporter substrate-binding protein [Acidimicrobiales bacterium]
GPVDDSSSSQAAAGASVAGGGPASAEGGGARGPNQASDVGVAASTIRLGTIVAENGVLGDAFAPAVWGLRAWVAHTNAQGGIAGRTIELFTCDDREDRARTLQCAKRLVERDRVFALVAVNTRSIGGAATYLDEAGIPVIGFPIGNAFNRFTRFFSAYGSFYPRDGTQVGFGNKLSGGTSSIRFYKEELGARRAAVFSYDIDESAQAANGLQKGLELEGFTVQRFNVSFAAPSFDTAVAQMQEAGAQVIFDTMDPGANIRLCDAMQRRGFRPLAKVTTVVALGEALEDTLNDACRPVTYIFGFSRPYSATSVPFIATFDAGMRRYQPGRPLHQWSLEAWVQGEVLRQALVAMGPTPTRQGLEEVLERRGGFDLPGVLAQPLRWDHRPEYATRETSEGVCFAIAKWDDDVPGHWTSAGGFPYCASGGQVYLTPVSEQGT